MAPVKVEDRRRDDIRPKFLVSPDRCLDRDRLGTEQHPGDVDRIAPDVKQRPSPEFDDIADVGRVEVSVREERLNGEKVTNDPFGHHPADLDHIGCSRYMKASISLTPACWQASTISRAAELVGASGFSQRTCLPAAAAALVHSA